MNEPDIRAAFEHAINDAYARGEASVQPLLDLHRAKTDATEGALLAYTLCLDNLIAHVPQERRTEVAALLDIALEGAPGDLPPDTRSGFESARTTLQEQLLPPGAARA